MTVTAPVTAARVPLRMNGQFLEDGAPAVVIDRLAEKYPGRVFLWDGQRSRVVKEASEKAGKVELKLEPVRWDRRHWVPVEPDEGHFVYAN